MRIRKLLTDIEGLGFTRTYGPNLEEFDLVDHPLWQQLKEQVRLLECDRNALEVLRLAVKDLETESNPNGGCLQNVG